ncbi:MAG: DUF1549 domain-containing protein [Pirellulales bacterium]
MLRRLTSDDADERMPPPTSNRTVTKEQIELVRRWIDEGALWGKHWAFESPQSSPPPAPKDQKWVRNAIDAFLLARLESEGLEPSPEADKATILRRVSLDLTGLPPTPEEFDEFLRDESPQAYEKVVDRLLASPRYGERWAWDWLDAARYADTNGYQGDPERTMWPWRDWVVRSINANMPYDQFTVEQLAGDLLPNATLDQKLATGFNRNHMFNGEGGRIAEETRVENVMDRTETTGTVWLGLTIGCARCHDHKFDPFTNKSYYELYAFFNNTSETGANSGGGRTGGIPPVIDISTPQQQQELSDADAKIRETATEVAKLEEALFPRDAGQPAAKSNEAENLSGNLVAALNLESAKRSSDSLREMVNFYKEPRPKYARALGQLKAAIDDRERKGSSCRA